MKAYFLVFAIFLVSCNDLVQMNEDPNEPTSVPAVNLFTQSQYELFNNLHSRNYNTEWTMLMCQYLTQNIYLYECLYIADGHSFDSYFQSIYSSVLSELNQAKSIIESDETVIGGQKVNQLALIEILSIYAYASLTEAFGAIPYSQSLSADNLFPKYDEQSYIYPDLLNRLNTAIKSIDENSGSFESGDELYNGDVLKWKKLGSSLMLRMGLRISDVDEDLSSLYVNSAVEYGVFESNDDNASYFFSDDPLLANPIYVDNIVNKRDDFSITDVLVDELVKRDDPRLHVYMNPNADGIYDGMMYGVYEWGAQKNLFSKPAGINDINAPYIMMDFAEVSFNLAEAIERGFINGNASQHYSNGITASMNFWGIVNDDAISDYIISNPYDGDNWKNSIGVQKWFSFYGNGHQAWTEWRRLDVPTLNIPENAQIPLIPVRLPYPRTEQQRNGDQLSIVTNTPEDMSTKLWFDKN